MTSQLPKTRIIPISDFYTRLQLEYISYKFRSLIYSRPFDKKKFTDICKSKKVKIDQIALENCLPSIFNNAGQQEKYLQRFFGKDGLPNFCYRDEYQTQVKGFWDAFHYFMVGSSVRFYENDQVEIGRIKECIIKEKKVLIEINDQIVEHSFDKVTRIFPSTFYENFFQ
jgi:hypothetical protein